MVLFKYSALNEAGKKIRGMIDAESREEAELLLNKKNIVLTELELFSKASKIKLSKKEILNFTEELSKLLQASLPLYDALIILKDKYQNNKMYTLILDLSDQIKRGMNFSQALSTYPYIFDFIFCSMVANSEKTGTLINALEELVTIMQRAQNLKKKVTDALLYPAILTIFCFIVICSLLFFVVPSLFDLFEGRSLHPLTKIVFSVSKFANANKIYLLFFSLGLVAMGLMAITLKKVKDYLFKMVLVLPIIKNLMMKVSLIRFSRSFSVLLSTGISYVEALKLAKDVMNHPILEEDVAYAEKKIIEGEKLSSSLKICGNIPPLVTRMLEIAEESGKTSEMLNHIAKIYEDDLEKNLTQLTGVLQPMLLLILGTVVGFVVLSVLIPLTDVSSFAG